MKFFNCVPLFWCVAAVICLQKSTISTVMSLQQSATRSVGRLLISPRRDSIALRSSSHHPDEAESSLSGLVNGMLQAHQEIAKETAELAQQLKKNNQGTPIPGKDGVYSILNEEQFRNFQLENAEKLVILKFSSPVCQACRALKQKFHNLHQSALFENKPVVFADIVLSNNKNFHDPFRDFVTSQLDVRKIPTVQFYSMGELVDTVVCGPEGCSWSKMKQQMISFVNQWAPKVESSGTYEVNSAETSSASLDSNDSVRDAISSSPVTVTETAYGMKLWHGVRRFFGRREG